ncbi:MAG: ABC transporter permease [Chloroflexi bacterium]|nr:ABC transporter permease [Chloroflexota bacterium]
MFKTRGRKILRDVLSRRGRTALVALSIMIGVFGAVALISVNDLVIKQIKEDIEPEEIAMTRLFVTVPSAGTEVDNETYLTMMKNMPGVTEAEGQVLAPVFWKKTDEARFREGDIMAFTEPFGEIKLEPMRLVKGEWPQTGQNQIAIEKRMADEYGLKVGDKVLFRPLGQDAEAPEWIVSGLVFHPYWVGDDDNAPEQRVYANYEDAQQIAGFSGLTSFYLRYIDVNAAEMQVESLKQAVADQTNYIPQGWWLDDPENYFLIDEVKQVTNVLNMLAVVALVVSGFLVTNVINTIVVEQKRQIGIMKSVGASRWDSFIIYAGIAALYGIIGTIPGVILGVIVGSQMAIALAPLASTLIEGFNISSLGVLVGVVMGIMVPLIAAIIPVFNGTRVTIREAMTDLGISAKWGSGPTARLIKGLPFPITVRQALSNVVQKKGRLVLTGITLTLAVAAFMGVFAVFSSVTNEIDKLYNTFNYDILIIPTEGQDYAQVKDLVLGVEGTKDLTAGVGFGVEILDLSGSPIIIGSTGSNELEAFGYDPASDIFEITYDSGSGWDDDPARAGLVLTSKAAEGLNKSVGDRIIISAGGRSAAYEIIGLMSYPAEFALMKWQDLAQLAGFVTNDNGTPNDFTDDVPLPNVFFVQLDQEGQSATAVSDQVDLISEQLVQSGIMAEFVNQVQDKEEAIDGIMTFNMIFQLTSGVMAAVGAIGLLATLSMAVFERQKEIGVMRSIGARSSVIISQFEIEGILIGFMAWLAAVPLSYLLAVTLMGALEFDDFIQFSYPISVLLLGLGGMMVIAIAASLWPSLAAARKTVSEILRYQ